MINSMDDIRLYWTAELLDILPADFEQYCARAARRARQRIIKCIGREAMQDAESESPENPERAEAVKDAEIEFMHVYVLEHLWRQKAAGAERDIQLPNGLRVTLQAVSGDDFKHLIQTHVANAETTLAEYI
ncbi:MAG: hypothetical protein JXK07_10015 [Spirochaetes bacterium]|nr:hypothetical protein [Spirochaetota bacterium]MBN2771267.1 hypothetical protein [Spirochaetota bacterium]